MHVNTLNNPLISIVLPVYKVEKYLRECLDSIVAQSYENLQIIAVNDGSPDDSQSILESYADKRLEIVTKENGGLSSARNAGIACARGEYLCFVDSDDVLHRDFVRVLWEGINEHKADLAVCSLVRFSDTDDIDSLALDAQAVIWQALSQDQAIQALYGGALMQQLTVACSKLYPRRIYTQLHFPEGKLHEDVAVSLPVLMQAERIAFTSAELYLYRHNNASITSTPSWRHIDGVDFYEEHFSMLNNRESAYAPLALLAAFKAGITCLAEFAADGAYRKDSRYRELQQRVHALSQRVALKGLRKVDAATVLVARINIPLAVRAYRFALRMK